MPAPLASWNPARDAWETSHSHIDLFSELSGVWSETFPSWGMWADGVAYGLPTPAHLTSDSASSSSPGLLGTPRCADGVMHDLRSDVQNPRGRLEDQIALLPTVRAQHGASRNQTIYRRHPGKPQNLENALAFVLDEEAS